MKSIIIVNNIQIKMAKLILDKFNKYQKTKNKETSNKSTKY